MRCLRIISENLRRDMCYLRAPGAPTSKADSSWMEQCLPADLQYSCRYWVQHLQLGKALLYDNCQVHEFIRKHLLHWLEALSRIGKTSDSVQTVIDLQSMIVSSIVYIDVTNTNDS